ncbi:MAG TPA: exodeoxyribonuclease VII small subunit [Lachnospiraceae bacterium]|nr:exodeoxyribonuclease VII small subunit [Lachnospiraceae bacterium]HIS61236.1 exodeoxyribonuclease VII small subunit [Candidatus Scybalomonas excrementigallinarum]
MAKRELSIEKAFENLDGIIEKLEDENTKLSDSIALYSKGVKLLNDCKQSLDRIEKQMIILDDDEEEKDDF